MVINDAMKAEKDATIKEILLKEQKRLSNFIRNKVANVEDAEDILQETFYQLTENFSFLEPIEKVASWLFKVASNKITDLYRKKKTESLESIASVTSNGNEEGEETDTEELFLMPYILEEDKYTRSIILNAIEEALNELPDEQREVFVMYEIEDKSYKEIAEITGASVNTLISRKRYATIYMRERLKDLYAEIIN
ncbi:MAG: RNA polymerase sigma factor [Bacteroidota bacterium]